MKVEHIAFHVEDPIACAQWWGRHLGFKVTLKGPAPGNCRFIVDSTGQFAFEIYKAFRKDKALKVPAYARTDSLQMHVAFLSENPEKDAKRLIKAGATLDKLEKSVHREGFDMVMLRDPWGIPLQLVKRAKSVLLPA